MQYLTGSTNYIVGYQYDLAGQVTALTHPSGRVVQAAYDTIGRLSALSSGPTTYVNNFSYAPSFFPISLNYGKSVSVSI